MSDKSCKCDHIKPCCLELAIAQERLSKLEAVRKAAEELINRAELMMGYKHVSGDPPAIIQLKDLGLALKALEESE